MFFIIADLIIVCYVLLWRVNFPLGINKVDKIKSKDDFEVYSLYSNISDVDKFILDVFLCYLWTAEHIHTGVFGHGVNDSVVHILHTLRVSIDSNKNQLK